MLKKSLVLFLFGLAGAVALAGCLPWAPATPAPTPTPISVLPPDAFEDPFAYCQALVNIDSPDIRYIGVPLPPEVKEGFLNAIDASPEARADENFNANTRWRCMDGQVYACNFGANLPCESPADTITTPNQGMLEYCSQNPAAEFIPYAYTGHATIYNWSCQSGKPVAGEQILHVDKRGFVQEIWYPIPSPQ